MQSINELMTQFTDQPFIIAIITLIVGWLIATVLKSVVSNGLSFLKLSDKYAKTFGLAKQKALPRAAGKLTFWVVMLMVFVNVFEILGLQSIIEPINQLLNKMVGFLPNLLSFALLLAVAIYASKIVKIILESLFETFDLDSKLGLDRVTGSSSSISQVITTVLSSLTFLLILPASLRALKLESISNPIENLVNSIISSLPHIIVALAVIGIGTYVAKIIQKILVDVLKVGGIDQLPERTGLFSSSKIQGKTLSEIIGTVVFTSLIVIVIAQGLNALKLDFLADISSQLANGYFALLGGLLILVVGMLLAQLAEKALSSNKTMAKIAKFAILIVSGSMALDKANLAPQITSTSYQIIIAALGIAFGIGGALALGLGGKDAAKRLLDRIVK